MNIFKDIYDKIFKKSYDGIYRAKIIEVDETTKNGIYKIKPYPYMANVKNDNLPLAVSTTTVRWKHINLKVDDWVWIFNENGDKRYPVIFDICNFKNSYPDAAVGTKPDYYDNISADTEIDETTFTYKGTYNKISSFLFGDNIKIDIDEDNNQILVYVNDNYFIIDDNNNIHIKSNSSYINMSEKFNVLSDTFKLLSGLDISGSKIEIDDSLIKFQQGLAATGSSIEIDSNTIILSQGVSSELKIDVSSLKLGGDAATESIVKGDTFEILMGVIIGLLISHTHGGVLPGGSQTAVSGQLAGLTNPVTPSKSNYSSTK